MPPTDLVAGVFLPEGACSKFAFFVASQTITAGHSCWHNWWRLILESMNSCDTAGKNNMDRWLGSLSALFLLFAALVIQRKRRRTSAIYQNGCQPPVHHRPWDPFLGIDLTIATHNDLPSLRRLHQKYGHTFATETLVNDTTIFTVAPENIKTVNMRHDHWGIEPQRLPGMEFFCGRGFLTMDGQVWKEARSLLKPSFAKGNISDLTVLSRETDKLLEQLPTDGQIVDLQPLLYIIVRPPRMLHCFRLLVCRTTVA